MKKEIFRTPVKNIIDFDFVLKNNKIIIVTEDIQGRIKLTQGPEYFSPAENLTIQYVKGKIILEEKQENIIEQFVNQRIQKTIQHLKQWKNVESFNESLLSIEKTVSDHFESTKLIIIINDKGYTIKTLYAHLKSIFSAQMMKHLFVNEKNLVIKITNA
jgi:hypothetical protein